MSRSLPFSVRKFPPSSPERRDAALHLVSIILRDLEDNIMPPADVARQSRRLRELLDDAGALPGGEVSIVRYRLMGEREGELMSLGKSLVLSSGSPPSEAFRWAEETAERLERTRNWPEGYDLALECEGPIHRRWAKVDGELGDGTGWEPL